MIWLHWEWVELASVIVPLAVVGAALRVAGVSWLWSAVAGVATGLATYVTANALFDVWVYECIAENVTPPRPPSWPWSPRREFCDAGSDPALGGFALLVAPMLVALAGGLLARTRLKPVGIAVFALLVAMPWAPELYVEALPYYRLDEYPVLHEPVLIPAGRARPAVACYEYGVAFGPRQDTVARPEDRSTCLEFERTRQAQKLTNTYDAGRTESDLERVGHELTERGLPVEPGETGVDGLVVRTVLRLTAEDFVELQARAQAADRRASFRPVGEPADCGGGVDWSDPEDDVADNAHVVRPLGVRSPDPRGDLRGVRLSSRNERICVAYETAADIEGPMSFMFSLRRRPDPRSFRQDFKAQIRDDGEVRVTSGRDDAHEPIVVPVEVGAAGRVFSMVIDRRAVEAGEPSWDESVVPTEPRLDQFAFVADVSVPLGNRRRVRDYLGPVAYERPYGYPDGRRCLSETDCTVPERPPLSKAARRTKPVLTRACTELGGRLARARIDARELACIVRYGGVPHEVPISPDTGRIDPFTRRELGRSCRQAARISRQEGRMLADARNRAVRVDLLIWHPETAICEARPRGQLIRP